MAYISSTHVYSTVSGRDMSPIPPKYLGPCGPARHCAAEMKERAGSAGDGEKRKETMW